MLSVPFPAVAIQAHAEQAPQVQPMLSIMDRKRRGNHLQTIPYEEPPTKQARTARTLPTFLKVLRDEGPFRAQRHRGCDSTVAFYLLECSTHERAVWLTHMMELEPEYIWFYSRVVALIKRLRFMRGCEVSHAIAFSWPIAVPINGVFHGRLLF